MKKPDFKVGDKVFAKIKGYPNWPARITAQNGKKYTVEFYGTGETGIIKDVDLFYYLKHKAKFQKPLKRKDYLDAFEQIEKAIKEDGGDGDPSPDDSALDESMNTSVASTKSDKKTPVKRTKSISEKSVEQETVATPKRKRGAKDAPVSQTPPKEDAVPEGQDKPEKQIKKGPQRKQKDEDDIEKTAKKGPQKKQKTQDEIEKNKVTSSKEIEFVPIQDDKKGAANEETDTGKERTEEKTDELDFKVDVVAEKILKFNIAYAKAVKEKESLYKERPVEPREDYINQVLAVKLPSGAMGGLKLHTSWPLKFTNEYERALYDESVALRVLEAKNEVTSSTNSSILNNPELFIPNINMTSEDVKQTLCMKDIEQKNTKLSRLTMEAKMVNLDAKIRNCLGLDSANPKEAVSYLEEMHALNFDDIMLLKHPHIVEMVRRLRKYVGNAKEWHMSEDSLNEFCIQAEKVRIKAEEVYTKFKEAVRRLDTSSSFWDGFSEILFKFREECKGLTESQIQILCSEPTSRLAFLDLLEEKESEKDISNTVANSEKETAVNGSAEGGA